MPSKEEIQEAMEAASRLANEHETKYVVCKAVATVETEVPPVKVTRL
jgi:hypothetical protein